VVSADKIMMMLMSAAAATVTAVTKY